MTGLQRDIHIHSYYISVSVYMSAPWLYESYNHGSLATFNTKIQIINFVYTGFVMGLHNIQ